MTTPRDTHNAFESAMELVKTLGSLPAPEKVYFELQRFNNNMERMQPDMAKLAKALEGLNAGDIRALAMTLQGMKISEMLLVMNDLNATAKNLYEKLWGKK